MVTDIECSIKSWCKLSPHVLAAECDIRNFFPRPDMTTSCVFVESRLTLNVDNKNMMGHSYYYTFMNI